MDKLQIIDWILKHKESSFDLGKRDNYLNQSRYIFDYNAIEQIADEIILLMNGAKNENHISK